MQKIMITMLLLLIGSISAKGQTCQWAEKIAGTGDEYTKSIVVDRDGNLYIAGDAFFSSLSFNNGITLTYNDGDYITYIAKYNSSGQCQWAEKLQGLRHDYAQSIKVDASGNVYVSGIFFSPTLSFNNGITLTNNGDFDGFLAKYNSSGQCQWAEKIAGKYREYAFAISVDETGNVYLGGQFESPILSFNNGITLSNNNSYDLFIAKYDPYGQCQWAERIVGTDDEYVLNLSVDSRSNVYIGGFFYSPTLSFNNGKQINNSGVNSFIAKYNSGGQCQWAETIACKYHSEVNSICVDEHDYVYFVGNCEDNKISFNNGITLTFSSGYTNGFIAKYNSSGEYQWAERIIGKKSDSDHRDSLNVSVNGISLDASGQIYITGNYISPNIIFNNDKTLSNRGGVDAYFAKYNNSGLCQWAEKIAGSKYDVTSCIAVDGNGNMYTAGIFRSPNIIFNNGKTLSNSGGWDAYIAKYTQNPDYVTTADGFSFAINPNPVKDLLTIDISVEIMATEATLTIYDLNGNEILTAYEGMLNQGSNSLQINCQALPNGVYNLILQTDSQKLTKRFVVAR